MGDMNQSEINYHRQGIIVGRHTRYTEIGLPRDPQHEI